MSNTNTPLHIAAQNGNVEIVKMLLDAGHDPSQPNAEGLTPLHLATQAGHVEIVALLAGKSKPKKNTEPPPKKQPTQASSGTATQGGDQSKTPDTPTDKALAWGCYIFLAIFAVFLVYSVCVSIHTGEAAETASQTLGNGEWWGKIIARILFCVIGIPILAALWAAFTSLFSKKK